LRWLQQQKGLESIELVISPSWGIQKTMKGNIAGTGSIRTAYKEKGFYGRSPEDRKKQPA